MRTVVIGDDYEISYDGRTVWVNRDALLGRFSRTGIDIHINGVCGDETCIPGLTNVGSWNKFKSLMMAMHQIEVGDKYMPKFLNTDLL
jgi:hypothetical protein